MSLEDQLYPLLDSYNAMPRWLRLTLGTAYRHLPRGWRYGARYGEFKELAVAGEQWSVEEIQNYQLKQLRAVLHHAANHCPFYEKRFLRAGFRPENVHGPEDLKECPFVEKRDLQEHLDEMVSTNIPASRQLYVPTAGSTGVPVGFYLQKGVSRPKEQAFLEAMWRRVGYSGGARLAVIRGQVTSSQAEGPIVSYDATRDWLMLSSYHLTPERLPEYREALEKFKPDFLHAYPSAALQLAEYLEKSGEPWRLPLRGLL